MAARSILLNLLLLSTVVLGFEVNKETTLNHQEITKRAFLNTTVQVCRAIALSEGRAFTAPVEPYTVENVLEACQAQNAAQSFYQTIKLIQKHNIKVDKSVRYNSSSHHFHNEAFNDGRDIVAAGLEAVKASNKKGNYQAAQKQLGKITHSVQDFYSHSNWIENGNDKPNTNLLKGNGNVGTIAAENRATCRSCGDSCNNNILDDILSEKVLTSGYFALRPSNTKPAGKCSHGGALDGSSDVNPKGGINKNTPGSSHGQLHVKAANMSIAATSELLEDVRGAAGDKAFLQMIGANTGKPLCFVVDTTGSMGDDILALQELTSLIISNVEAGMQEQPSVYILVTFNDPAFGPVLKTTDSKVFQQAIDSLSASKGGDLPEMSLSGLQLALTAAPPNTDIFLFTDAPAKDENLKNNLIAIAEQKKSVVNFLITGVLDSSQAKVYNDLALASGGQVMTVPKSQLSLATDIVFDSSSPTAVILLEAVRNPGKSENFTFALDDTVNNVIVYVTGSTTSLTFVSPSGGAQTRAQVIASSTSVGNVRRIKLIKDVGLWQLRVVSNSAYTVKVIGESPITFIYDFLGTAQGPLGGLVALDSRPIAGVNGSMELTLIGSDNATVTEVYLVETSGTGQVKGNISQDYNEYLVQFDNIPTQEFSVLVKGTNTGILTQSTTPTFQRQSTTSIKGSSLSVTADELNGIIEPGASVSVPFTISSDSTGIYTIQAANDQGFSVTSPSRLELTSGSADGKVILTAPGSAESGTEVTLTIKAEATGGTDMNYVVISFTVLNNVTDFSFPVCEVVSQTSCTQTCGSSTWQLSIRVSDGTGGSGIDNIYLRQGNGTLSTRIASDNAQMASYEASCCSSTVEMVVVDSVGNVGTCTYTARAASATTPVNTPNYVAEQTTVSMTPRLVQSSLLCLIIGLLVFHFSN